MGVVVHMLMQYTGGSRLFDNVVVVVVLLDWRSIVGRMTSRSSISARFRWGIRVTWRTVREFRRIVCRFWSAINWLRLMIRCFRRSVAGFRWTIMRFDWW